jgi:putative sterol carrier protein
MKDETADFFESLRARGHQPLLEHIAGTLRFDIGDDGDVERWSVVVDDGDVAVSRASRKADCRVRASRKLFDGFVTGETNALAAYLRGAVEVEGDPELLLRFQRIFPGPPVRRRKARPAAARS